MVVEGLFKNVFFDYEKKTIRVNYNSFMGEKLLKEIEEKTSGFEI